VEITLSEDKSTLRLVVEDRGQGRQSDRPGFGTRMIAASVKQLSGQLVLENTSSGLRAIMSAPINA